MAVLVEAISVIVKGEAILEKYPGDFEAFKSDVPNGSLCADGELARVGFMAPDDVSAYINDLESKGLVHLTDGEAADIVVADQQRGFTTPCSWAEVGRIALNDDKQLVTACQLVDAESDQLITPDGWDYEGSLSQTFGFAPTEHVDRSLVFLRAEENLDVYLNVLTGKEVFVGRTSSSGR